MTSELKAAVSSRGLNEYGFRLVKKPSRAGASKSPQPSADSKTLLKATRAKPRTKSVKANAGPQAKRTTRITVKRALTKLQAPSGVTKARAQRQSAKTSAGSGADKTSKSPTFGEPEDAARTASLPKPTRPRQIVTPITPTTPAKELSNPSLTSARTHTSRAQDEARTADADSAQGQVAQSDFTDTSLQRSRTTIQKSSDQNVDVEQRTAIIQPSSRSAILSNLAIRSQRANEESKTAPVLSLSSLPPRLQVSTGLYDEYIITTTCRVPHGSTCPEISIAFSEKLPTSGLTNEGLVIQGGSTSADEQESDNEPLINRFVARAAVARLVSSPSTSTGVAHPPNRVENLPPPSSLEQLEETAVLNTPVRRKRSEVSTAARFEYLRAVASEEHKLARRHMPRAISQTFYRGGRYVRQPPSGRPALQHRDLLRKTPTRTRSVSREPPTVRRRKKWDELERNMKDPHRRRYPFPRRRIFQQSIVENVTLERLEKFWLALCDLVAQGRILTRQHWDRWEYLGACVRLINESVPAPDKFGMAESDAAAKELVRQRMIMYTSDGKIMLTPNALSTRLS